MRLNSRPRSDAYGFLDLGKGTNETVVSNFAAVEIAGLHDPDARAE
jgi:hypothetical protein